MFEGKNDISVCQSVCLSVEQDCIYLSLSGSPKCIKHSVCLRLSANLSKAFPTWNSSVVPVGAATPDGGIERAREKSVRVRWWRQRQTTTTACRRRRRRRWRTRYHTAAATAIIVVIAVASIAAAGTAPVVVIVVVVVVATQ